MFFPKRLLTVGAIALAASVTVALPAQAATTKFDDFRWGDMTVELREDALSTNHYTSYDSVNADTFGDSTDHDTGAFGMWDQTADVDVWNTCDSADATDSLVGDDLVIDCAPVELSAPFSGLVLDGEVRIFAPNADGFILTRVTHAVENTGAEDVTLSEVYTSLDFHAPYGVNTWNGGSSSDYAVFTADQEIRRFSLQPTSEVDDTIDTDRPLFGAAWHGIDSVVDFYTQGDSNDDDIFEIWAESVVVPAGETVYFVFYQVSGAHAPDETEEEGQARLDAFNEYMTVFDGDFDGQLVEGLPEAANVLNWGPIGGEAESLADTGTDANESLVLAAVLLFAGAVTMAIRRRARA